MIYLLFIPIMLQAFALFFDEFHYHWKRGLPRWERLGHPIDTLSVILCFAFASFFEFELSNIYIFLAMAAFSTLLVTKDEFVHAEECEASEAWLHSVLFVLHPIVFVSIGFFWYLGSISIDQWPIAFSNSFGIGPQDLNLALQLQLAVVSIFFIYQIVYWSFIWQAKNK